MKTSKRKLLQTYFPDETKTVAGWGRKPSARRAKVFAALTFRQPGYLEDGFLRSLQREDAPISLVLDRRGIYYDATAPSDLEELLCSEITEQQKQRARRLITLWRDNKVSKYNHLPESDDIPESPYVLILDQVAGDKSVEYGLADRNVFHRMLDEAEMEYPDAILLVKVHPDVAEGRRDGHFDIEALEKRDRVRICAEAVHPVELIRNAQRIYTVTSQVGFEAIIHGIPVSCYGMPFYAGYGLTHDRASTLHAAAQEARKRRRPIDIETLVHSALIDYPAYVDPANEQQITPEEAVIAAGRHRDRFRLRKGTIHAVGFSLWKKPILRNFLAPAEVVFHENMKRLPLEGTIALWGDRGTEHVPPECQVLRIEDGFIRSKGLGADLTPPSSWVIDDKGIYFDSTRESRLEDILQNSKFPEELIAQARELRHTIVESRISKYNIGGKTWQRPRGTMRVILVPGQVESDASIRLGSPVIKTNLDLVKAVRIANPDAYVLYKPHPDVLAGFRSHGETEARIPQFCDEVIEGSDITLLLSEIDEVHTMTSLSGFEALIRGLPVTCYGQPFYSGWGLTTDINPCERRTNSRTLDELVSAALILYPDYISQRTGKPLTAIAAIAEILDYRASISARLPFRRQLVKWAARRAEQKREAQRQ